MNVRFRAIMLEDSATDAELELRTMRKAGIDCVSQCVETEAAFRAALNEFVPDFILSDFTLPGAFDGMMALSIVRQQHPDIPFIFVSGTIGEETAVEALKHGATDYVLKDNLARLVPAVRTALREADERKKRRQAEDALRETKNRLASILSSLKDVVWSTSPDGRTVLYVNFAAEEIYFRPVNEFYRNPRLWLEVVHPDDRQRVLGHWATVAEGAGADMEYRIVCPDGSVRWLHDRRRTVHDEHGRITRIDGLARDITDRKQHEERIKLDLQEKEILLHEIHHRVKNNLQVVRSLLELQCSRIQDQSVVDILRESQNRIASMALVHETLYHSRDLASVNFGHFLESLVPSLVASYGIDPNHITIGIDSAEVLLPLDAAIPCGLLVNELVTNALKHAFPPDQPGEIKIDLSVASNDEVVLTVSDNGVGMPVALDVGSVETLGLKLVNLLIDQLHGKARINRARPTRFVLQFPRRR